MIPLYIVNFHVNDLLKYCKNVFNFFLNFVAINKRQVFIFNDLVLSGRFDQLHHIYAPSVSLDVR